jgi:hypothetical protein
VPHRPSRSGGSHHTPRNAVRRSWGQCPRCARRDAGSAERPQQSQVPLRQDGSGAGSSPPCRRPPAEAGCRASCADSHRARRAPLPRPLPRVLGHCGLLRADVGELGQVPAPVLRRASPFDHLLRTAGDHNCRISLFRIKRRASAADRDRSRPACWRPPAGIGRRGGPHPQRRESRGASGGGAQASGMVAIPTTIGPGRAEQTCPAVPRSFGRGALHLVTAGRARSTVCGSTADGMAARSSACA